MNLQNVVSGLKADSTLLIKCSGSLFHNEIVAEFAQNLKNLLPGLKIFISAKDDPDDFYLNHPAFEFFIEAGSDYELNLEALADAVIDCSELMKREEVPESLPVEAISEPEEKSNTDKADTPIYEKGVLNRLRFEEDFQFGFTNERAAGRLPERLPQPLLLNLGCGNDLREGFLNIDLFSKDPRVIFMDIRRLELPDSCADLILASDILEHFSHREIDSILKEWARALKPDGELIIRCPNLRLQLNAYLRGEWNADVASYMIFGGQTNPGDYHCTAFDKVSITSHLAQAGFSVVDYEEHDFPQNNGFINLNMTVRARKNPPAAIRSDLSDIGFFNFHDNSNQLYQHVNQDVAQGAITTGSNASAIKDSLDMSNIAKENLFKIAPVNEITTDDENQTSQKRPLINIVWEGSQFVYHSFALINREHCSNILDTGLANLTLIPYEKDQFSYEGNKKYERLNDADIRFKPDVSEDIARLPYIWIRHQWPPKAEPPLGAKWVIMQPWEFSQLRQDFADIFSQAAEIWTPSNWSRMAMIDSGIDFDKVQVVPNGIDPVLFKPSGSKFNLPTEKKLKFLFVGGTIFRKGIDVLLQAYSTTFTDEDDVSLIIKDMGGESFYRNMTAKELIEKIKMNPKAPEIIYYDDYFTELEMAELYRACDVFVCSYRGEGFSLPTLEAMACGLPVIVTQGGSTDDFVDEDCGWQIPARRISVGKVIDGKPLTGEAFIFEPDIPALIDILKSIYEFPGIISLKGILAQHRARTQWTWKKATLKLLSRVDAISGTKLAQSSEEFLQEREMPNIIFANAEIEYLSGNTEEAKQFYLKSLEMTGLADKYAAIAFNRLSLIAIEEGNLEMAEDYLQNSEDIFENQLDSKYIKAKILSAQEKYIEALESLTPTLDNWKKLKFYSFIGYTLSDLLTLTGSVLFRMDDLENALKVFTTALEVDNQNADACLGAGLCFASAGAVKEARTMLEWAIKLAPNFAEAAEALAALDDDK
ncbi:MAG: hypothetical protein QG635_1047 [Bacteroidota bacterium]|nr:hypothetical protein [Bacteroidota bacterium]